MFLQMKKSTSASEISASHVSPNHKFLFQHLFSELDYLTDRYSLSDTLKIIHATILRTTILAKIASFAAAAAAVAAVFAAEERKWRQWVCFNNILELPERFLEFRVLFSFESIVGSRSLLRHPLLVISRTLFPRGYTRFVHATELVTIPLGLHGPTDFLLRVSVLCPTTISLQENCCPRWPSSGLLSL